MKKKILSVLASAAILGSMACATAVNTSAFSGDITFEIPEGWAAAARNYYAHIWRNDGTGLYEWQTKDEKMKVNDDETLATYTVPEGEWELIIISADVPGIQTYDTVFKASCIGDTCYVLPDKFENPVDSKQTCYGLGWRANPDCGPHKVVSSLGNVIGNAYLEGESDQSIYDAFVKKFNPENATNGLFDGSNYLNWNDDGKSETGMEWEEAKAQVAQRLGIQVESSSQQATEAPTNANSTTSSSSSTSSTTSSTSSTSSSSSSTSTGTTTTGDSTPYVALAATLTAALGVAFAARKKA
ncbi:MAG: hypothetical protein UD936_05885 [Acutalibacteraceae bacterium]|nr:hypothetical protein [Acutalibacteraceae bacterium]